jgi:hypothetical protein
LKKITTKELVAGTIGALLGGIDGWFKGFYGIDGPIVGIVAAIVGAFLGVVFVREIAHDNQNRVMLWGGIGCLLGVLMGTARDKGIGYTIANGVDWTALGIVFGLGFEKNLRRVKVGAAIGAVVGFILAIVLRPDNIDLGRFTMPGDNWLAVCVIIIGCAFWGMIFSIAFSSSKGETNVQ